MTVNRRIIETDAYVLIGNSVLLPEFHVVFDQEGLRKVLDLLKPNEALDITISSRNIVFKGISSE